MKTTKIFDEIIPQNLALSDKIFYIYAGAYDW